MHSKWQQRRAESRESRDRGSIVLCSSAVQGDIVRHGVVVLYGNAGAWQDTAFIAELQHRGMNKERMEGSWQRHGIVQQRCRGHWLEIRADGTAHDRAGWCLQRMVGAGGARCSRKACDAMECCVVVLVACSIAAL